MNSTHLVKRTSNRRPWRLLVAFVGVLAVAGGVLAQSPAGQAQTGFAPIDDYILEVNGQRSESATLHSSNQTKAILVISSDLPSPVLLWPRTRTVESLQFLKVAKQGGEFYTVLPDPVIATQQPFRVERSSILFSVDDVQAALKMKPPLVGLQDLEGMVSYSKIYGDRADSYVPVPAMLNRLNGEDRDVTVRVFFGSWCPACGQMVPRIMRVARELSEESSVKIEYYGLPRGFDGEPEAAKYDIKSVPTAVVLLDGKEFGRIEGNGWMSPERTLGNLLGGDS